MSQALWWFRHRIARRWLTSRMPPHVERVINAARQLNAAWSREDVNLRYEATFELLNAVHELEMQYGDNLGEIRPL